MINHLNTFKEVEKSIYPAELQKVPFASSPFPVLCRNRMLNNLMRKAVNFTSRFIPMPINYHYTYAMFPYWKTAIRFWSGKKGGDDMIVERYWNLLCHPTERDQ